LITPLQLGSTTINVKWVDNEDVEKTININVLSTFENNLEVIIMGDDNLTINTTKQYEVILTNNGKPVEDTINWSIVGTSATIVSSDNHYCTIKAVGVGSIALIARWHTDEIIKDELNILCKDLW